MSWERINTYSHTAYGSSTFIQERLEKWLSGKGIKKWSGGRSYNVPNYLKTGRKTIGSPNYRENIPPYFDHASFFKATNPLKVWLVYHPYNEINNIQSEIEKWVEENNLDVEFYSSEYSWYSDDTSMVIITTK